MSYRPPPIPPHPHPRPHPSDRYGSPLLPPQVGMVNPIQAQAQSQGQGHQRAMSGNQPPPIPHIGYQDPANGYHRPSPVAVPSTTFQGSPTNRSTQLGIRPMGMASPSQLPLGGRSPGYPGLGPQSVIQPRPAPKPPIQDLLSTDLEEDEPNQRQGIPTFSQDSSSTPPSRPLPPSTLHLHSLLHSHLSTRLPQLLHSLSQTTTQLLSVRSDLESGEPAIKDEMNRLEAVNGVCQGVVRKMEMVVEEGGKRVGELEGKGEVGVDEVVCSVSIVHNQ